MILIAGDSWGYGEWPQRYTGPTDILHGGVCQYLRESGRAVVNISQGGNSNQNILEQLNKFFDSGTGDFLRDRVTDILVFQTEWYRDFAPATYHMDFDTYFLDIIDSTMHLRFVSRFYRELSELAKKHKVSIKLIGGAADTIWLDQFNSEYPGVSVVCQSFVNLCVNNNHRVNQENFSISSKASDFLKGRTTDPAVIEWIESLIDSTLARQTILDSNPYFFFPDGKHANRLGHKKLFDFLIDTQAIL